MCHFLGVFDSFKVGAVEVNVSPYADGRVCGHWSWGRKRFRVVRKNLAEVKAEARRIVLGLGSGNIDFTFSRHKAESVILLEEKLGNTSLEAAVHWYLANHQRTKWNPKMIPDLVAPFLEHVKGNSPAYEEGIRGYLERLVKRCRGPIHEVNMPELVQWIKAETPNARARNNIRGAWTTFFRWARDVARALPMADKTEAELVPRWKVEKTPISIYSPDQYRKLMQGAQAKGDWELVAFLTLSGMCGARSHEITGERTNHLGLQWEDVLWEEKMVRVGKQKVRTKGDRLTPLGEAALSWLRLCGKKEGKICRISVRREGLNTLAKQVGVALVRNGLRHSYITYRMALVQNAHQVADECGNSPGEIYASYRKPELKRVAMEWFGVRPSS